jgi:hypothetical protein
MANSAATLMVMAFLHSYHYEIFTLIQGPQCLPRTTANVSMKYEQNVLESICTHLM